MDWTAQSTLSFVLHLTLWVVDATVRAIQEKLEISNTGNLMLLGLAAVGVLWLVSRFIKWITIAGVAAVAVIGVRAFGR